MRNAAEHIHALRSERGSVLMEFCLMLPIWLLIFGGTVLALRMRRPDPATIAPPAALDEGKILALLEKPVLKVTRIP